MSSSPSTIENEPLAIAGMSVIADHSAEDERKREMDSLSLTIDSWNQIGSLASEIVSSVMAKQASFLSRQFAADNDESSSRPNKKRRMEATTGESQTPKSRSPPSIVTSSEEEGSIIDSLAEESLSLKSHTGDPLEHYQYNQIDRLGRMSRLMIQMEFYHKKLRDEMIAMAADHEFEN